MGDNVCTQGVEGEIHCKNTKNGDFSRCGNHKDIILLSITVLNRIVLNRIKFRVGLMLRDIQAGFRRIEHVQTFRLILEQSAEWMTKDKAYDKPEQRLFGSF